MSAEVVNVGYAGVGKHAVWSHIEPQVTDLNASIRVLHDLDTKRLEKVGLYHPGARLTSDWEELLASSDVDAVYAITPDRYHTAQLLDILSVRKHAFVEKPLADTWQDYWQLRGALLATPEDVVVISCHPRRFDPPFVNTKRLLDDREMLAATFGLSSGADFGPVRSLALNLNYSRPSKTGLHTSFASDHLPHEMDTASHFFGFQGLRYAVSNVNRELEFDIKAEREDGIALHFRGNRLQDGTQYHEDWQIGFDEGVQLSVSAHTGEIALSEKGRPIGPVQRPQDGDLPLFVTNYDNRFDALNRHFISSIMGNEAPYLSRNDLLLNTVAALALQEVGKPVAISADGNINSL